MKIERKTITTVMIDESTELVEGDNVKFIANDICYLGRFVGVSTRGALKFEAFVNDEHIAYAVMPASIKTIEVMKWN